MFYVLSDTHLSTNPKTDKSMAVFGRAWENYMTRIQEEALKTLQAQDILLIAGDISWAMNLEEAEQDLRFLHALPGLKILVRGNHDYWWNTVQKMQKFCMEKGLNSLVFQRFEALNLPLNQAGDLLGFYKEAGLQEASIDARLSKKLYEQKQEDYRHLFGEEYAFSIVLASTRAWLNPTDKHFQEKDRSIYERECLRMESALQAASKIKTKQDSFVLALHYPPLNQFQQANGFYECISKYAPHLCLFGHLHGFSSKQAFQGYLNGTLYVHTAADALEMKPLLVPLSQPISSKSEKKDDIF